MKAGQDATATRSSELHPPVREEVWYEVRCPKCGWHITDLTAGSKCRKECPRCKRTVIRAIPDSVAA